jgi:hypothetical protein
MPTKNVIIRRTMLPQPPQLNNRSRVAIVAAARGAPTHRLGVAVVRVVAVRIQIALAALVLVASAMPPVGILLETQVVAATRRITLPRMSRRTLVQ